jgi:hypothetical protein
MATQALEAFNTGNYALAVTLYTALLSQYPSTLDYYIKRSTAHQRISDYASALSDAEIAIVLAHKRGRKDVLAMAQLRRGIALYMLKRYGDAMVCFDAVRKLNDKERGLDIWVGKCEKGLRELPEDDARRSGNVKEIPDVEVPKAGSFTASAKGKENVKPNDDEKKEQSSPPAKAVAMAAVQTPASKIRHEWYQTTQDVVFTLLAKGVPKDKASIDIQEQDVSPPIHLREVSHTPTVSDNYVSFLSPSPLPLVRPTTSSSTPCMVLSTRLHPPPTFILPKSKLPLRRPPQVRTGRLLKAPPLSKAKKRPVTPPPTPPKPPRSLNPSQPHHLQQLPTHPPTQPLLRVVQKTGTKSPQNSSKKSHLRRKPPETAPRKPLARREKRIPWHMTMMTKGIPSTHSLRNYMRVQIRTRGGP